MSSLTVYSALVPVLDVSRYTHQQGFGVIGELDGWKAPAVNASPFQYKGAVVAIACFDFGQNVPPSCWALLGDP